MSDTTIIILALLDLIIGFLIWFFYNDYFNKFQWQKSAILKSLLYSFFFGVGSLGEGGGDPGFMLPYPVGSSAIVALTESNFSLFLQNTLMPYGFWAIIFFIIYSFKHLINKIRMSSYKK